MAKDTYTGLVKIKHKKCWKKSFNEDTLEELESIFNKHFIERSGKTDNRNSYINILMNNLKIIHLETDIFDDTEGVGPKVIKKFISKIGIEYLGDMLIFISEEVMFNDNIDKTKYQEYSEDHRVNFFNFNKIFKDTMSDKNITKDMLINYIKEKEEELKNREVIRLFNESIDNTSFGRFFYNKLTEDKKKSLFSDFKENSIFNVDMLVADQINDWENTHSFKPNAIEMFYIKAIDFDRKIFLELLLKIYKTKQFHSLSVEDRIYFIRLYKVFGSNLPHIKLDLLSNKDIEGELVDNVEFKKTKSFNKIVSRVFKGVIPNITLMELIGIKGILSMNKNIDDLYFNKKDIFLKDLNLLLNFNKKILEQIPKEYNEIISYLFKETEYTLKSMFSLNEKSYLTIFDLFLQNKDNECNLPNIKFVEGEYEIEIIKKNDFRGYIATYPFACQYIGGTGERFTRFGYEDINSSFLVISKKGEIVAQSWIWIKENQLTFDSIDLKGNADKQKIKSFYNKISEKLLEDLDYIDIITAGNNNGIFNTNVNNFIKQDGVDNCYDSDKQYLVMKRD